MIRVLHVFGGLGTGGTESLIMNWYRNIDREKIQFDFLVRSPDDHCLAEIEALGGRVFYTASFPRHFLKNYRQTKEILARKEWDVIHVHGNAAIYMLPLKLAKKYGYACRIMHSHNVRTKKNVYSLLHACNSKQIAEYATHNLACSAAAGEWMFADCSYGILHNAIDMEAYRFDSEARQEIRTAYGLGDKCVIGHVGRFVSQKNHSFLLESFKFFKNHCLNSVLMLVGDGELEPEVKAKAEALGLTDSVLFLGRRSDVGRLMSAMDLFVLPSVYEGLGIVLVEAQCSGLPCVVSEEAYNGEVEVYPELMSVLPLSDGPEKWAAHIYQKARNTAERNVDLETLRNCGYDMKTEIACLEELYLQAEKG